MILNEVILTKSDCFKNKTYKRNHEKAYRNH